ncbi:MAG: hypothetical protein JWQ87_176 [Candidatus Sulfotelmatobacter sp.]|nr:hypothetical protein [Candidatus Sulfotelmatobacter sp.]
MRQPTSLVNPTEDEYWRIYDLIRGDVEAAIKSNRVYFTVNNLVVEDRKIQDKINRAPEFWQLNAYALQTTFFIAFGRLFDVRCNAHSVLKLVDATIANPQLFSKSALRARKRKASNIHGADPEWLVIYLADAWQPATADLAPFKSALEPHYRKFKDIYQPIRHLFFAHRGMERDTEIFERFQKTNVLHTLLWAIWQMGWNAKRPDLTDFSDYDGWVKGLNAKTEKFIRQLP